MALALLTVFATLALAIGGSYALALHALDSSEHRWCALLDGLTARPPPPTAPPRTVQFYRELVDLRDNFGC